MHFFFPAWCNLVLYQSKDSVRAGFNAGDPSRISNIPDHKLVSVLYFTCYTVKVGI